MHAEGLPHGSLRGFRWWRPCWGAREGRKDGWPLFRVRCVRYERADPFATNAPRLHLYLTMAANKTVHVCCRVALTNPIFRDLFEMTADEGMRCHIEYSNGHRHQKETWNVPHRLHDEAKDHVLRLPLVLWGLVLSTATRGAQQLVDTWGKDEMRLALYIFTLHRIKTKKGNKPNGEAGWKMVPYINRMIVKVTEANVTEAFWFKLPSSVIVAYDNLVAIASKGGTLVDPDTTRRLLDAFKIFLPALQQALKDDATARDMTIIEGKVGHLIERADNIEERLSAIEKNDAPKRAVAPMHSCMTSTAKAAESAAARPALAQLPPASAQKRNLTPAKSILTPAEAPVVDLTAQMAALQQHPREACANDQAALAARDEARAGEQEALEQQRELRANEQAALAARDEARAGEQGPEPEMELIELSPAVVEKPAVALRGGCLLHVRPENVYLGKLLGEGAYGSVYAAIVDLGVNSVTLEVACKTSANDQKALERELGAFNQIQPGGQSHPGIVRLCGFFNDSESECACSGLLLEKCVGSWCERASNAVPFVIPFPTSFLVHLDSYLLVRSGNRTWRSAPRSSSWSAKPLTWHPVCSTSSLLASCTTTSRVLTCLFALTAPSAWATWARPSLLKMTTARGFRTNWKISRAT